MKVSSPLSVTPALSVSRSRKGKKSSAVAFINTARSSLIKTIKVSTNLDVNPIAPKYFCILDKWIKAEGKRSAVLRAKSIYVLALNSMNNTPKEVPYVSTNKRGFPRKFEFLETFYRNHGKSPQAMQAVLSICGYYRGILAPGIPDLSTIVDEGEVIPDSLLEEIISLGFNQDWKFHPKRINPTNLLLRSKRGPNGQATLCAALDAKALPDSLFKALQTFLSKSDDADSVKQALTLLRMKAVSIPGSLHSKLSIKRELGGKDRAFAMVDFWSQTALKPLHDELASILGKLSQDCMFDQGKGQEQFKSWTRKGEAVSLDLSSASDRIPILLQKRVLLELTGDQEYVNSWASIMVDRGFRYKSKDWQWAVGQPLGALSSWPSFALTHHIVMRAAYAKAKISNLEYFILGDDIAMRNSLATTYYKDFMQRLGISFSTLKGLEGYSVEFAKRIWNNGVEVSPIPMPMIQAMLRDIVLTAEFVAKVTERSSQIESDLRVSELSSFLAIWFGKDVEYMSILVEYPIPLMRSNLRDCGPEKVTTFKWAGIESSFDELYRVFDEVRYRRLISEIDSCQRRAGEISRSLQHVELPGTPASARRMHPIFVAHGNYSFEIESARNQIKEYMNSSQDYNLSVGVRVSSIKTLIKGSRKNARHNGKSILELYQRMKSSLQGEDSGPKVLDSETANKLKRFFTGT